MIQHDFNKLSNNHSVDGVTVSVILPVYNVEPWIGNCIESLKNQTQPGLEFIFIDDCGSDRSMELVKKWAADDNRVRIFHNDMNIGPGPSRNKGIEVAMGEYLSFIDPDDYVSHDFFNLLYTRATKNGVRHTVAKGQAITEPRSSCDRNLYVLNNEIERVMKKNAPLWTCFRYEHWSAIYHRDLFLDVSVRYGSSRVSEDTIFLLKVGSVTNDIVIENNAKYYYVKRPHSGIQTYDIDRFNNILIGLKGKRDALASQGENKYVRNYFDSHLPWLFNEISKCLETEKLSPQESKKIINRLDSVLRTLPHYDMHMKKTPEYSLLINHGIRIPILYYNKDDQALRRVVWEEVIKNHPEIEEEYSWVISKSNPSKDVEFYENNKKKLIVSLTSYPARMSTIHLCLDSLYKQSLKADMILVWLAEEQFPNKEGDLPSALIEDTKAGKIEVRWCDDIGSHKKYFYAMQEFPNDIIVTVDDDIIYAPDTLEKLFASYAKNPTAISAHRCSLLLFNNKGELLPCSRWVLPYEVSVGTPSHQLMPIGSRGILYPPGLFNKTLFDKDEIIANCSFEQTVFFNDSWIKIHALSLDIPVVLVGRDPKSQQIKDAQSKALKSMDSRAIKLGETEFAIWKNIISGNPTFAKKLSDIRKSPNYIESEGEAVLSNIACKFQSMVLSPSIRNDDIIQAIHYSFLEINRQRSLRLSDENLNHYIHMYQRILEPLDLGPLSESTLALHALVDYGCVLRTKLFGSQFRTRDGYETMLNSWNHFLHTHPNCNQFYREGYALFLSDLKKAESELGFSVKRQLRIPLIWRLFKHNI